MTKRYFLYARKSQGRSDRQMLSISGQIDAMSSIVERQSLHVVEIYTEARTAKEPGRPVFKELLDRIDNGDADGILTWKIDRLSRNPIDDGRISWMLQRGIIQEIKTTERSYLPEDNVLFMRMEQGMANQYIRDLSKNVKRGMRNAAMDGWLPLSILPLGYIRNKDKKDREHIIIKDPERFPIIQELWRLYRTGSYSILEIRRIADQLGLTNQRGKPVTRSVFYRIFQSPFYAGYFFWKDSLGNKMRIEGKHKSMVSEADYIEVQDILANKSSGQRPKQFHFPYKDILSCGECGGGITAERKQRTTCSKCKFRFSSLKMQTCPKCSLKIELMNSPIVLEKIYYHCTKRKNIKCSQKSVSQGYIESVFNNVLLSIQLNKDMYTWAKHRVKNSNPFNDKKPLLIASLKKKCCILTKKMNGLLDLRVSGEISKHQYDELNEEYQSNLEEISNEIVLRESQQLQWELDANNYLDFAVNCVNQFRKASSIQKTEIISTFLSNQYILDKTLYFSIKKPLEAILASRQ